MIGNFTLRGKMGKVWESNPGCHYFHIDAGGKSFYAHADRLPKEGEYTFSGSFLTEQCEILNQACIVLYVREAIPYTRAPQEKASP